MTYEGEWKEGHDIAFLDTTLGGTEALVQHVVPNEIVKMRHAAVVDPQHVEVAPTVEMMRKWIGSREDCLFGSDRSDVTTLEVVMLADGALEEVMNAWSQARQLVKDVCEA